ncbi:MAG: hypothetical protein KF782_15440 [Labilithrix sp.]|nr:hypothetical protein [Labilithrix sp.]
MTTPDKTVAVNADELHVLDHTTAWRRGRYRNYFTAGDDSDSWPVLTGLVEKGLMTVSRRADATLGRMTTFMVSDAGLEFLRKALP